MSFEYKATGRIFEWKLLKRIFALVSEYRVTIIFSFFLTVIVAALGVATPILMQKGLDQYVVKGNIAGLEKLSMVIFGVLVMQTLLSYYQTYYTNWLGQMAILKLRDNIFNHILKFRLKVFDTTPVGMMITRTISDVESVADIFSQGLISIFGDVMLMLMILGVMFFFNWKLSLVTLSVFPFLLATSWIFKEKVKVSFQDVRQQVARLNAFLQEHITGMNIVQIFHREEKELNRFHEINAKHRDANIRSVLYYSIFFPVIEIFSAIAVALIVWYGGKNMLPPNNISFGEVTSFILFINLLFRPLRQIADKFNTLQMGMVASDRIFKVMDMEDSTPDTGKLQTAINGQVSFENVWFAYNEEDWVLKDISFDVKPGQVLAIVGHTGAGKSSIISLINRLYEKTKGNILIDGEPVENYGLDWLRSNIAVVLQDVFLFSDTIENNIRLYDENITKEQILEAARLVGADKFINHLPGGIEYQVQERGATLSTGQRQLISFIRAVIQNPKILILDEATSSIDNETEELIQQATKVLLQGRTSIVVAHRLATIRNADMILVMEKGRIKEVGKHDELLEKGGLYRKLYELQFTELVLGE